MRDSSAHKVLIIGGCGYVGSALRPYLIQKGFDVSTLGLEQFGNFNTPSNINMDMADASPKFLAQFDSIVLLAGYSSVAMCKDEAATMANNVEKFKDLLQKLRGQKLIYASSSSVYGATPGVCTEETPLPTPTTAYDDSKQRIDALAKESGAEYYGLRMGTVNGPAANLRVDLVVNGMYHGARTTGRVPVYNAHIRRAVLGMHDLCRAIEAILASSEDRHGIYNLASFNSTVIEIARAVSRLTGAPIENLDAGSAKPEPSTFDYQISSAKFARAYNFEFKDTLESIVAELEAAYETCTPTKRTEPKLYAMPRA